jgi:hypothetical protein
MNQISRRATAGAAGVTAGLLAITHLVRVRLTAPLLIPVAVTWKAMEAGAIVAIKKDRH